MSNTPSQKRKPGRPRNAELDRLQRELAISRRHASTILGEKKSSASANSEKGPSPLAEARLQKTLREIQFLETKIRSAELEVRALSGELLYLSEAQELVGAAQVAIKNTLASMPKTLAPRLYGQTQRAIENALADFAGNVVAQAEKAVSKVQTRHRL